MMSRTRQIPLDSRRLDPGLFEATAPESAKIASSSSVTQTKCSSTVVGREHAEVGETPERRLPVSLEVEHHLRARLEHVGDHPGAVLVGDRAGTRRYRSSEHAGVQSGAVTIRIRSSRPCQSA